MPPRSLKTQNARSRAFANRLRTVAFQRCARWADTLILARIRGDKIDEKRAEERLDEAINDACNRNDITNGFATAPSSETIADTLTSHRLTTMTDTELTDLADGLWNDPLAAEIIATECERRNLTVTNIAPDENTDGDPWAGPTSTCPGDE